MKKMILVVISILVVGLVAWYFLLRKPEKQGPLVLVDSATIIKILKLDPNDKELAVVWVLEKDGKRRLAVIRRGITDNTYTAVKEVVWGYLNEGDVIILGVETTGSQPQATGLNLRQISGGIIR